MKVRWTEKSRNERCSIEAVSLRARDDHTISHHRSGNTNISFSLCIPLELFRIERRLLRVWWVPASPSSPNYASTAGREEKKEGRRREEERREEKRGEGLKRREKKREVKKSEGRSKIGAKLNDVVPSDGELVNHWSDVYLGVGGSTKEEVSCVRTSLLAVITAARAVLFPSFSLRFICLLASTAATTCIDLLVPSPDEKKSWWLDATQGFKRCGTIEQGNPWDLRMPSINIPCGK